MIPVKKNINLTIEVGAFLNTAPCRRSNREQIPPLEAVMTGTILAIFLITSGRRRLQDIKSKHKYLRFR